MRNIVLITLAGLAIFATAAVAHQGGWGNNHMRGNTHMQQSGHNGNSNGNGCAMNGSQGTRGQGAGGNSINHPQNNNWQNIPSYQGQTDTAPATDK